jgi:5'-nucleotidase
MRILITNDDGIHAEGLGVCEQIARALSDDVWVIAPEYDQSGVSHSLSLNDPLRLREVGKRHFAVKGTPTDCVIMGARHILKDRPPDLVLSGVNRGRNAGEDVIYSGTVAGAVEATVLGIPALALSQAYLSRSKEPPHWDTALAFAPDIIRRLLTKGIPRDLLINVNFPNCAPNEVAGIAVSAQGRRTHQERLAIEAREDGRGNAYYWIAYVRARALPPNDGTDMSALAGNRISVTPLRLDMTDEPFLHELAGVFADEASNRKK